MQFRVCTNALFSNNWCMSKKKQKSRHKRTKQWLVSEEEEKEMDQGAFSIFTHDVFPISCLEDRECYIETNSEVTWWNLIFFTLMISNWVAVYQVDKKESRLLISLLHYQIYPKYLKNYYNFSKKSVSSVAHELNQTFILDDVYNAKQCSKNLRTNRTASHRIPGDHRIPVCCRD